MFLSTYNVNQQLAQYFRDALYQTPPLFNTLKTQIISKQCISAVHAQIVSELNTIKTTEQAEARKSLEKTAYQQQIDEDYREKTQDNRDLLNDQHKRTKLTYELLNQRALIDQCNQELFALNLSSFIAPAPAPQVIHHHSGQPATKVHTHPSQGGSQSNVHTHPSTGHVHNHHNADVVITTIPPQPDPRIFQANALRQRIFLLTQRTRTIDNEIAIIDQHHHQRELRRTNREDRVQARLELAQNKPGITVANTLSATNQSSLRSNIQARHQALEGQCTSLIKQAEKQNYPVFLQEVEPFLNLVQLKHPEVEALRTILKLMKQHIGYETKVAEIKKQLSTTIGTINKDQEQLRQSFARLESLKKANPHLHQENADLATKNNELEDTRYKNSQSRDKFATPSVILSGVTLAASIPLILTLSGVTPFFIAPALLYSLVAIPPALLLIATLALGITAITFAIKTALNTSAIQSNKETINKNKAQMEQNQSDILQIETQTIPALKDTIVLNQRIQHGLETSLQETQTLAAQTLQQAYNLEPQSYAQAPFLIYSDGGLYPKLTPSLAPSAPPMEQHEATKMYPQLPPYNPMVVPMEETPYDDTPPAYTPPSM